MNIDIKTADGEEIEFGGAYYDGRGNEHRVVGIRMIDHRHITKVSLSCLIGKVDELCCVSMRPNELYSTPPDSWEKLEEDLDRVASCGENGTPVCAYTRQPCAVCKFHSSENCTSAMCADIESRIRKLRGED